MQFLWEIIVNCPDNVVELWGQNVDGAGRKVMRRVPMSQVDGIARLLLYDEFAALEGNHKSLKDMFSIETPND